MMDFYNHRSVKARKVHKCEMCGQEIKVEEAYSYESGKWEGDFFERKMHSDCYKVLDEYLADTGHDEFNWDCISDWWRDEKCYDCIHRYLPCEKDEQCEVDFIIGDGICPELTAYGTCKAGDTCSEMTHVCWCKKYGKVTT